MATKYKIKQLLDEGFDFSVIFPEQQKAVQQWKGYAFNLQDLAMLVKTQTKNFTERNDVCVDMDAAIYKSYEKWIEQTQPAPHPEPEPLPEPVVEPVVEEATESKAEEYRATIDTLRDLLEDDPTNEDYKATIDTLEEILADMEVPQMAEGGEVKLKSEAEVKEVLEVSLGKLIEYSEKIPPMVKDKGEIPAWIMSKVAKAEQGIANVKHTLQVEHPSYFEKGGEVGSITEDGEYLAMQLKHIGKYSIGLKKAVEAGVKLPSWMQYLIDTAGNDVDEVYHYLDFKIEGTKFARGGGIKRGWSEIRSDHVDDDNVVHIDAWISEDDNEGGKTIALVKPDKTIVYLDDRAKTDTYAQEVISEVLQTYEKGGEIKENTYAAFYKGKEMEVKADTSLHARDKAAVAFKAKKAYDVSVVLVKLGEEDVIHSTSEFAKGGDVGWKEAKHYPQTDDDAKINYKLNQSFKNKHDVLSVHVRDGEIIITLPEYVTHEYGMFDRKEEQIKKDIRGIVSKITTKPYEVIVVTTYAKGGKVKNWKEIQAEKRIAIEARIGEIDVLLKGIQENNTKEAYEISQNLREYKAILQAKKLHLEDATEDNAFFDHMAKGGAVKHGKYKYGCFNIDKKGEHLQHVFRSDDPSLDMTKGKEKNQIVKLLTEKDGSSEHPKADGEKFTHTKDGVKVEKGSDKYKGHIFYEEDGTAFECLGYHPEIDDCIYKNVETGQHIVGCMDGFYFKKPAHKKAKGGAVEKKKALILRNVENGKYVETEKNGKVTLTSKREDAMIFWVGDEDSEADAESTLELLNEIHEDGYALDEVEIQEKFKKGGAVEKKDDHLWIKDAMKHKGALRRKAKELKYIKGEEKLTLEMIADMKKKLKGAWIKKLDLAERLMKMPHNGRHKK